MKRLFVICILSGFIICPGYCAGQDCHCPHKDSITDIYTDVQDLVNLLNNNKFDELYTEYLVIYPHIQDIQNRLNQGADDNLISILNILVLYDAVYKGMCSHCMYTVNSMLTDGSMRECLFYMQDNLDIFLHVPIQEDKYDYIYECIDDIINNLRIQSSGFDNIENIKDNFYFIAWYYNTLSMLLIREGYYNEADSNYLKMIECLERTNVADKNLVISSYSNYAEFLARIGDSKRAIEYYRKVIELCEGDSSEDIVEFKDKTEADMLLAYSQYPLVTVSVDGLKRSLRKYADGDKYEVYFYILHQYVLILESQKKYEEIVSLCQSADNVLHKLPDKSMREIYSAFFKETLAYALMCTGQHDLALEVFSEINEKDYKESTYKLRSILYPEIHGLEDLLNSYGILKESGFNSVEKFLPLVCSILVMAVKQEQEIDVESLFEDYLTVLSKMSVLYTEKQREEIVPLFQLYSQAFWYYCEHFNKHSDIAYDLALVNKNLILSLDVAYNGAASKTGNSFETEDSYLQEKTAMYSLMQPDVRHQTWRSVQEKLGTNSLAVEFVYYIDETAEDIVYAAIVIKKDEESPKMVKLGTLTQFEELVGDDVSLDYIRNNEKSEKCKRLVWDKILRFVEPKDTIYFAPSGILSVMCIENLPGKTEDSVVGEEYQMIRLSSTDVLLNNRTFKQYDKCVLFGDLDYNEVKLPYTEYEITSVAGILSNSKVDVCIYSGEYGTERAFCQLSGQEVQILHLATHGFFDNGDESDRDLNYRRRYTLSSSPYYDPMLCSGLILSGRKTALENVENVDLDNDGVLLSEEILHMDLKQVDLLVLSACSTGLGTFSDEGVYGLQRAFKRAGVNTIIMSLWNVNDVSTAHMMTEFYKYLMSGDSKREAFGKARASVREKYKDPYYWAPFIMLD